MYIKSYSLYFHLSTVTSFTARGAPLDTNIATAMDWANSNSFSYVMTGQPVYYANWNDDLSSCTSDNRGLGYISMGWKSSTGTGWKELLDGNGQERRYWPARNCPQTSLRLISLCQDASAISDACVYDHRWRVGNFTNCVYQASKGKTTFELCRKRLEF